MILARLVEQAHGRLEKHRRYYRMVAEIQSLSQRDLSDMRVDRSEMLYWARKDVFG
ncbi:MAG: hypothetical protein Q8Q62_12675 [Mesorhizobium sp.]|nr:hypothetical protein [Mesorhizobium sp.]